MRCRNLRPQVLSSSPSRCLLARNARVVKAKTFVCCRWPPMVVSEIVLLHRRLVLRSGILVRLYVHSSFSFIHLRPLTFFALFVTGLPSSACVPRRWYRRQSQLSSSQLCGKEILPIGDGAGFFWRGLGVLWYVLFLCHVRTDLIFVRRVSFAMQAIFRFR